MARTVIEEVNKAKKNGINAKSSFTGQIRQMDIEYLHEGDVILFKEDYTVLDQPIRGSKDTAEMIYVDVKRGENNVTVPFYPSAFWKSRELCDEAKKPTGQFIRSNGEVVDYVQSCDTLDEAIKGIAKDHPNGVKVAKMDTRKTLRYGEAPGGRTQNANVPTLVWA